MRFLGSRVSKRAWRTNRPLPDTGKVQGQALGGAARTGERTERGSSCARLEAQASSSRFSSFWPAWRSPSPWRVLRRPRQRMAWRGEGYPASGWTGITIPGSRWWPAWPYTRAPFTSAPITRCRATSGAGTAWSGGFMEHRIP